MISVIIPTCNRLAMLSNCLDLLNPETQGSNIPYEIIVSDDSKNDLTKKLIAEKYEWAKWVAGPQKGPASNRNNGAKSATNNWLIFIDDDCLPDKNLLSEYSQLITRFPNSFVFEGCIKADRIKEHFLEESPINEQGGYLWSCNFMISKSVFSSMQGFDENFPFATMEDVDFEYRLRKMNQEVVFAKNAFVVHPWRKRTNIYSVTLKRFKSLLFFLEKHPEKLSQFNFKYNLTAVYFDLKSLILDSYKFRFRGFWGMCLITVLDVYFACYFLFPKSKKVYNIYSFII